MIIIILNILISWFFEVYKKHFEIEHELDKHRSRITEEHKNDHHVEKGDGEHHVHHNHDVENSLSRIFQTLERPVRQPVCHVTQLPFGRPWPCGVRFNMMTCDVCLRPTRLRTPCGVGVCSHVMRQLCVDRSDGSRYV